MLSLNLPKRGIHWAKWKKIYLPREEDEIGFCMIHEFNLALLSKQLLRLVQYQDSLVTRVLRGRYYIMSSSLRISYASSHPMYGLVFRRYKNYCYWKLDRKYILEDPWIPTKARLARPTAPAMHLNIRVNNLINGESKEWDVGLLENYVSLDDIPLIKSLAVNSTHLYDTFVYTKNGYDTVKSGYWVTRNLMKTEEDKDVLEPSIAKL